MSKQKQLTIKLKANTGTLAAQLIEYLESHPDGVDVVAFETLAARLMPFVLDPNDKTHQSLCLQYIEKCVSYVSAARAFWNLPQSTVTLSSRTQVVSSREEIEDEPEWEEEEELLEIQSNDDDEEEYGKNGYYGEDKDGVDGLGRLILGDLLND